MGSIIGKICFSPSTPEVDDLGELGPVLGQVSILADRARLYQPQVPVAESEPKVHGTKLGVTWEDCVDLKGSQSEHVCSILTWRIACCQVLISITTDTGSGDPGDAEKGGVGAGPRV